MRNTWLMKLAALVVYATVATGCAATFSKGWPDPVEMLKKARRQPGRHSDLVMSLSPRARRVSHGWIEMETASLTPTTLPRRMRAGQGLWRPAFRSCWRSSIIDGDGRVSRTEFLNAPTVLFDRLDTDHNGELSQVELQAAKAMSRSR